MGRRPRTVLEIGPGFMVVRAPVLAGLGARRTWFVDPADSAPTALAPYRAAAAAARAQGLPRRTWPAAPTAARCWPAAAPPCCWAGRGHSPPSPTARWTWW